MLKKKKAFFTPQQIFMRDIQGLWRRKITKNDYFHSRDAYEDLYYSEYVPLYHFYHQTIQAQEAVAKSGSSLEGMLNQMQLQYRSFFGDREEDGGSAGMSRYDVPAACREMKQRRYCEDYAGAVYQCEKVLMPLIYDRIDFLQKLISELGAFPISSVRKRTVRYSPDQNQKDVTEPSLWEIE